MSSFPGSPHVTKGGIVLIDPGSSRIERVISDMDEDVSETASVRPSVCSPTVLTLRTICSIELVTSETC